jgi:hypothetical protein
LSAAFASLLFALPAAAAPSLVAHIDLSRQRMTVSLDGAPIHDWSVSTAARGYRTPTGSYRPGRMYRSYFSRKYDNAPMPYAIFFRGGYAVHGTNHLRNLGRPREPRLRPPASGQRRSFVRPCPRGRQGQYAHRRHPLTTPSARTEPRPSSGDRLPGLKATWNLARLPPKPWGAILT